MKTTIKLTDKKLRALIGDNQLKKAVIEDIIDYAKDPEERFHYINNILNHGCISGTVGALIYYTDTTKFYQTHKEDIFNLAEELGNDIGYKGAVELFASLNGAKDVGSVDQEENLRAWFGFEEMVRIIANELGIYI